MTLAPGVETAAHRTTLAEVLEARLESAPRTIAIETEDRVELTRGQLLAELRDRAREIDRVARQAGGFVEIVGDGGLETALSCLSTVMSGRAYAVVDPQWPQAFRERVREQLRPVAVVTSLRDHHVLEPTSWTGLDSHPLFAEAQRERPCCVFFTSGTTGNPKGVVIPHRALLRTCDAPAFLNTLGPLRMPQFAPLTWDAAALELWAPLLNGGTCLIPSAGGDFLRSLTWAVDAGRASAMWLTASLGNLVIDSDASLLAGLEVLLIGGERLSEPHINRLAQAVPSLRITNGYGPVETTVFATTHAINPTVDLRGTGVPLGRPIAATSVVVLDEQDREAPHGTPGEVVIRGDGVALGYLGVQFDENGECGGFRRLPDGTGTEYRTGDIGVMRKDGVLEYRGRRDAEVKVSGVRVDIASLEQHMLGVSGVGQVAVVRKLDAEGNVIALAARVVAQPFPERDVLRAIHAELAHLPSSARPTDIELVAALPRTSSGKVDRGAIERALRLQADAPQTGEPVDLVERSIQKTLGTVDLTRSLAELGTSSLLAIRLASQLRSATGRDVTVAGLYRLERLDAVRSWVLTLPVAKAPPRAANLFADIAARYWMSEAVAPACEAHIVFCGFQGGTRITDIADVEQAIRLAAARYLSGVRGILARPGGIVRTAELNPEIEVVIDDSRWTDGAERARRLISEAGNLHNLETGPIMAFSASLADDRVEILGAFHHAIVDGESLRTIGSLLEHALAAPSNGAFPELGSAVVRQVEWAESDLEFWRATLGDAPRLEIPGATYSDLSSVWKSAAHANIREITPVVQRHIAAAHSDARAPELAAWLHLAVGAMRQELGDGDICIGTMVRVGRDEGLPRGCAAQPLPLVIEASATSVIDVASVVLDALDHASVPYSEILGAARVDDPFGPYRVIVNMQDERARAGTQSDWLPRALPPTGPVAELYLEFVLRDDEPPMIRVVTPDSDPYRGIGARIADRIADGSPL